MSDRVVAVIIKRKHELFEGLRTTLGLAVENIVVAMFVLDIDIGEHSDEFKENLEWLDELECEYYSNNKANIQHGFKYLDMKRIVKKLEKMDNIIPF
ncbi:MAG: hypothetical protein OMM_10469 [Candidatus Magnetoglobus multicellularis str. Araruama]|uniref:Uncharacterized protein n=1 Tax=Candidatus Magnetoglobus multicellularis str. Araruama TaxID=890399 RepID=A0A1V1P103_9BACT|nr:MAG: hypothetical protein OMM_10469 [Candidatus Magnetoglobus multicellularis str. Araruama]